MRVGRRIPSKVLGASMTEVLMAAAVIGLLSGLAMMKTSQARFRTNGAQALQDLTEIKQGVIAYEVDHGAYPYHTWGCLPYAHTMDGLGVWQTLYSNMTTPIAYVSELKTDVFGGMVKGEPEDLYMYVELDFALNLFFEGSNCPVPGMPGFMYNPPSASMVSQMRARHGDYFALSLGPHGTLAAAPHIAYDPTNGMASVGNYMASQLSVDQVPPMGVGAWSKYE